MRKLFIGAFLVLAVLAARNAVSDTKISQLPLGNASTTGANDSFPYVDSSTGVTKRLDLSDLLNLPSFSVVPHTNQANTYTSGPQSFGTQVVTTQLQNDSVTGTLANKLAKLTSSGKVVVTSTSDVNGVLGIVAAGAGVSGNADIAQLGQISCVFDGSTTAGDYVVNSSTVTGACHDAGAVSPTSQQAVGRVLSTNAGAGTYAVVLFMPSVAGSGGAGGVSSVDVAVPSWMTSTGGPITGSGTITLGAQVADSTHDGYLSLTDWGTFNGKQNALTFGNLTTPTTGVSITGGTGAVIGAGTSLSIQTASGTQPGLLSAADWSTFNGKQAAGNYITALTGDVAASGPGSVAATIQSNVVSNSKLAQMAAHTYKGNNTGSTANASDVTSTQLTADLNLFSSTLQGLVPASGGGTTNFLRADGSWAAVSSPLTFSDSLVNTAGTVTLVNDSATPGASKYYGTNGSSTLGFFSLPTGFTNPMTTLGDLMYEDATPAAARLAGNTTTTKKFLTQTGTGTVSAAPGWNTISATDVPDISATYAKVDLSNLSATAVNTAIVPGTTLATNLGSNTKEWNAVYTNFVADSANHVEMDVEQRQLYTTGAAPAIDWHSTAATEFFYPIKLDGSSSGSVTLSSGATPTAHTVTLPSTVCSVNQVWSDNGSGTMSCATSITASLTGNASTATALASTPTQCSGTQWATGIAASGNANCTSAAFSNVSGTTSVSQVRSVNGSAASPSAITAAGGITAAATYPDQVWFIQGSGGAVTITANPQISAGTTGQQITICGESDTNTVTFSNGTGIVMNGTATLYAGYCISGYYDGTNWQMIGRNF